MGLVQLPLFFSAIHVGKCNTPWEVQDPMKNGLEVEVDPCKALPTTVESCLVDVRTSLVYTLPKTNMSPAN